MNIHSILPHFQLKGHIQQVLPFGNGHINDTFLLKNTDSNQDDYLLQRINHQIFKNVAGMMANIWQVTEYLNHPKFNSPYTTLTIVSTMNNQHFHKDKNGNYWRVYIFIKNMLAYDVAENETQIYEGAKAFGHFLAQLNDFPTSKLHESIANFHNIKSRFQLFQIAFQTDIKKRNKEAFSEIKYVTQLVDQMSQIEQLGAKGKIPLRVTHNDTKFNNVLLDKEGKARAVVDLDTIMLGYVHYDFGDGIRTTASIAAEDEVDLKQIQVDLDRYKAFVTGYLEETRDTLSSLEIQYLPLAGPLLAYIMGLRFLTDFLAGDVYYKIHFEKQNLQRAKAQLNLCKKLLARTNDVQMLFQ